MTVHKKIEPAVFSMRNTKELIFLHIFVILYTSKLCIGFDSFSGPEHQGDMPYISLTVNFICQFGWTWCPAI